ncbi:MAG: hypothetical protein ABSA57_08965 [Candidatus Acidiferrales bacterium]|jgi:hypothetical protein
MRYCAQCGWQKKQTEEQLRMNLKAAPIVGVALLLIVAFSLFEGRAGARKPSWTALVFIFPAIPLAVSYALARRNLRILLAQPPPTASQGAAIAGSGMSGTAAALRPRYEALLKTSPPRRLRLSRRGKFNVTLVLIVVAIFAGVILAQLYRAWAGAHSFAGFQMREWGLAGFAVLLLLILVSQWRYMDRERDLLTNGEVVAARIVQKLGARAASAIRYEYEDFAGQTHSNAGTDYTQKLGEGMSVPVFYDRVNPRRQVPACGTFHEVVLEDEPKPGLGQ